MRPTALQLARAADTARLYARTAELDPELEAAVRLAADAMGGAALRGDLNRKQRRALKHGVGQGAQLDDGPRQGG